VRIVAHVADRIEVHEAGHGVDHHQHDGGQRVDANAQSTLKSPALDPAQQPRHAPGTVVSPKPMEKNATHDSTAAIDQEAHEVMIFEAGGADGAAEQAGDQAPSSGRKTIA
jgi:hypothetical protein